MARRLILALLALLCIAAPARADPIVTPIVTAILGQALAGTVIVGTLTVGALVSSLVTFAVGIGLTLLFAPRPKLPAPENGAIPVQQNVPYRIFAFGRTRVAGAIMLLEESNGYLCHVAALVGHLVDGFENIYANDDNVSVPTAAGNNFAGLVTGVAGGRYGTQSLYFETRTGANPNTASSVLSGVIPSQWNLSHRGDGQATLSMLCGPVSINDFTKTYPYGQVKPSTILRAALVYDPRDDAQSRSDPTTWKWSTNVALIIAWWLCDCPFGFGQSWTTAIVPWLSQWVAAANDCDELQPLKAGGTEPRFACGGWGTTESARAVTLQQLLACCDGWLVRRGAAFWLQVGKYYAPTVTLTDADILGYKLQSDLPSEERINVAVAKYASPSNGYTTVDTDPLFDLTDLGLRQGAPRRSSLDIPWVQSTGQASRLLKAEFNRKKVGLRGQLTIKWSGLNALWERWIAVQSNSIPGFGSVVIENTKPVINVRNRTATIDFFVSGPAIYAYTAATDESAPPFVPTRPSDTGSPVPANLRVVPTLNTDNSTVILFVSWDDPNAGAVVVASYSYNVEWRLTSVGGTPGAWAPWYNVSTGATGGRIIYQSGVVTSNTSVDVAVESILNITASNYSSPVTASTATAALAPFPASMHAATGGTGSAAISAIAPNSSNLATLQFYRCVTTNPFSSAVAVGSPIAAAAGATISTTDTVTAGIYDYYVEAISSLGVASIFSGPLTTTVH